MQNVLRAALQGRLNDYVQVVNFPLLLISQQNLRALFRNWILNSVWCEDLQEVRQFRGKMTNKTLISLDMPPVVWIRIYQIHMFLGLLDPDPDDPDPLSLSKK